MLIVFALLLCASATELAPAPAYYPRIAVVPGGGGFLGAVETPTPAEKRITALRALSLSGPWLLAGTIATDGNASGAPDLANPHVLPLADSRALCAYRHHTGVGAGRVFRIALSSSSDGGATWSPQALIIASASTGLWEPFLFALAPSRPREIGVAYAAELSNGGEQDIVFQFSRDGGASWLPPASRIHSAGSRNGMPGVARLDDGTLVAVFEGFRGAWGSFSVSAAASSDGGATWPESARAVVHAPPPGSGRNAGSPQIARCPASSDLLCFVYMTDEPRAGGAEDVWPAGASIASLCARWTGALNTSSSAPAVVATVTPTAFWPSLLATSAATLSAVYQTPGGDAELVDAGLAGCEI